MRIKKIVTASYTPDYAAIAKESGGLSNVIDAQFDHGPGWAIFGVEIDPEGAPLPEGFAEPRRVDGSFPRLYNLLQATHILDGNGGMTPLEPDHPARGVGHRGYGSSPEDWLVHVDENGVVWGVTRANHYDLARASEIEIQVVDLETYRPWE